MKFPLSWLKEYIAVDLPADQLAKILTSAGLEVDSVTPHNDDDFIFEVSLTPNLGHCHSLLGIARELSAALEKPINIPTNEISARGPDVKSLVSVEIKDSERCPRYACRLIQGVKIAPSPDWLQQRLLASGVRPVNNVVDVTNYVLLETGQPLHAFDFDQLKGSKIVVRTAKDKESFVTLDDQERILSLDDLLICDNERPVALAGVMGGLNSEVESSTQNILIESAYFSPGSIRRTSKRLGLQTDASKRFERHADPQNVLHALDRAVALIQEITEGTVCQGYIDVVERLFEERVITCRLSRINSLLGTQLSVSEVENLFQRLSLTTRWDGQDLFEVKIPTYRADLTQEVDLIEEIARLYGYENIPCPQPYYHASLLPHTPLFLFENRVRSCLVAEGLQELLTCNLIGPSILKIAQESMMPESAVIKVLNPTSIEQSVLRTSLLPGLLQVIKYNWDHQIHDLSGFEIGRIHFKEKENYHEQTALGIVLSGKSAIPHWKHKSSEVDFFELKGIMETFLESLGISNPIFQKSSLPAFHPGRQLAIYVGSLEIGSFGEVHPSIIKRLDVPQRAYFAEVNLNDLYKSCPEMGKVKELAQFPGSTRDWTISLPMETPVAVIFNEIHELKSPLLEEVKLLDVYENDALGKGMRNVTFRFFYRNKDKTLSQESVDAEHGHLINEVSSKI